MTDPVSVSASIAGLVTLADIVFIRAVKYIKAAKGATDEVKSLCDSLQSLSGALHGLSLFAARLDAERDAEDYPADYRPRLIHSCTQLLGEIRKKLEKYDPSEPGMSRVHSALRQLKWPFATQEVKDIVEKIEQHKSALVLALSADTFQALHDVLSAHRSFQNDLAEIKSAIAEQRQTFEVHLSTLYSEKEQRDIYDFFGSESPEDRHRTNMRLRHPETGLWLLDDADFIAWIDGRSPKLWLTGIPGSGKTVLASVIIEEAWSRVEIGRIAVAYFYCDYKDTNSQDPVKILGSIATQLAQQSVEAFELLRELYKHCHPVSRMSRSPESSSLVDVIRQMCGIFEDIHLIVDGLDECGDHAREVTGFLRQTDQLTKSGNDAKIALLSSEDLRLYVASEMENRIMDGRLDLSSAGMRDEILKALVEGADGMFRWAACQMDYVCEQADDHDRWMALKSLPPDLDETYKRILMRVDSRSPRIRTLVQRTLRWLIYAKRRLKINELCVAVSIDPETHRLDLSRTPTIRTLLTHCSSLVRLSSDGDFLELTHFTVQEFLTAQSKRPSPQLAPYVFTETASNVELTRTCLTYLNLANFDINPFDDSLKWEEWLQSFPFREYCVAWFEWYAMNYWDDDIAFSLMKKLFQPMKSRIFLRFSQDIITLIFLQHFRFDYSASETLVDTSKFQDSSPLHLAAWLQIAPLCRWLINQGCSVNEESLFGSPLHFALLGKDVYFLKAISTASFRDTCFTMDSRKADVVQILADAGADVTVPYLGINNQTHSILSILFNIDPDSDSSLLPLFVNILLSAEAQPDESFFDYAEILCNLHYVTGVRRVLNCLSVELVKYGLEGRFVELCRKTSCSAHLRLARSQVGVTFGQVESSDTDFRRLHSAASMDHSRALVETLERYSIDVNVAQSASGNTLLHVTSKHGSYACAEVLLRSGVDIEKRNQKGETALHKCATNPDGAVLSLLMEYGAHKGELDNNGCSIYHLAAANGNTQILRTLCEHPGYEISDLLKRNKSGLTPVLVAAEMSESAFRYLLTMCNDLSGISKKSGWGVIHFSTFLSLHTFKTVLSLGVDLNLRDRQGRTALHICCEYHISHRPEKMALLIDKGLDPCATDDGKRIPLHALLNAELFLSTSEFEDILDKVASPSAILAKDADGNLPIHLFLRDVNPILKTLWGLQRLLEGGTDFSACVVSGNFRLQHLIHPEPQDGWTEEESTILSELILQILRHPTNSAMLSDPTVTAEVLIWAVTRSREALVTELLDLVGNISEELLGGKDESIFQKCIDSEASPSILKSLVSKKPEGATYRSFHGSRPTLVHLCCENQSMESHEYLRILLDAGADVNATCEPYMETPLMLAARAADAETIEILLQYGADVTKQHSRTGWTSLHYAANRTDQPVLKAFGKVEIEQLKPVHVQLRLPDSSISDSEGSTLVHICSGHARTLEQLLDTSGALDLNCRNAESQPPLHLASILGEIDAARVLVSNGADVSAQDIYQKTALHYCCIYERPEMVEFLISHGSEYEAKDDYGRTPLHYAARHGFKDIAQQLVKHKCKQSPDSAGRSPELLALMNKHTELAEFLREARTIGIEQRAYISGAFTALSNAILEDERDTVIQLLDRGISMDYGHDGCSGCSPLLTALETKNLDLVDLFISRGVEVGGETCRRSVYPGASAVHLVLRDDSLTGALRKILSKTIPGDLHLDHAIHPIHFAVAQGNNVALQLLLQHYLGMDDDSFSKKSSCIMNKNASVDSPFKSVLNVPVILNKVCGPYRIGNDISTDYLDGCSPLHVAAIVGNEEASSTLMRLGANIDSRDRQLQSPLHKAAKKGSISVLKHLLACGANPHSYDAYQYTPALLAVYAGQLEAFIALEQYGLHTCRGSITDDGFLQVALYYSSSEMLAHLLHKGYRPTANPFGRFVTINAWGSVAGFPSLVLNSQLVMGIYANHIWDFASWTLFDDTMVSTFNKLLKRVPSESAARKTISNKRSTDTYSPLCYAAIGGQKQIIDLLIDFGADVNVDGCKFGPPLMTACKSGHLAVVATLVRRGAEMTYFDGERTISAVKSADYFPQIQHWLLIDRFTEQQKISYASEESGQAVKGYWAGPQAFRIPLTRQFGRFGGESTLDHACRLSRLRRDFEGEILSWPAGAEHPFICLQ